MTSWVLHGPVQHTDKGEKFVDGGDQVTEAFTQRGVVTTQELVERTRMILLQVRGRVAKVFLLDRTRLQCGPD